jgi:hypothetical protein
MVFRNNSHDIQRASLKSTNFLRSLTPRQAKITRNIWFVARNPSQHIEALTHGPSARVFQQVGWLEDQVAGRQLGGRRMDTIHRQSKALRHFRGLCR